MSENLFNNVPPKDVDQLNDLLDFPPTVSWVQKADENNPENIRATIVREAPNVDKWLFSLSYKSEDDNESGKISFTVSKDLVKNEDPEAAPEFQWNHKIENVSGVYKENSLDISGILSDFNVSTYSIQGTYDHKFSPSYEKKDLVSSKRKESEISRELSYMDNTVSTNKRSTYKI